jgi:hypothetical protein
MYNWFAVFWRNVERQRERELYADVHAWLYDLGYTHQYSFYGTLMRSYDGVHDQARIEVLIQRELDQSKIKMLYRRFSHYQAAKEYTLFIIMANGLKEVFPM